MISRRSRTAARVCHPRSMATRSERTPKPQPPTVTMSSADSACRPARSSARPLTRCPPSQKKPKVRRWTSSRSSPSGSVASALGSGLFCIIARRGKILDQMRYLRGRLCKAIPRTYVNDARSLEFRCKDVPHPFQHGWIQCTEHIIDDQPCGFAQHSARKRERSAFCFRQVTIPAPNSVQGGHEALKAKSVQCIRAGRLARMLRRKRIGESSSQRTGRQVRHAWHVKYLLALRQRDSSGALEPKAREGAKQQRFPRAGIANDQHTLTGAHGEASFGESRGAYRAVYLQIFNGDLARRSRGEIDLAFERNRCVAADQGAPESRDPQQGRAPVGNGAEIVDEPAQRGLHLHER